MPLWLHAPLLHYRPDPLRLLSLNSKQFTSALNCLEWSDARQHWSQPPSTMGYSPLLSFRFPVTSPSLGFHQRNSARTCNSRRFRYTVFITHGLEGEATRRCLCQLKDLLPYLLLCKAIQLSTLVMTYPPTVLAFHLPYICFRPLYIIGIFFSCDWWFICILLEDLTAPRCVLCLSIPSYWPHVLTFDPSVAYCHIRKPVRW